MTNYNDGKWHGWNGGKCPVHPETKVEAVEYWDHMSPEYHEKRKASDLKWGATAQARVIAFRVIEEYKELWLVETTSGYMIECSPSEEGARLFREVVQD